MMTSQERVSCDEPVEEPPASRHPEPCFLTLQPGVQHETQRELPQDQCSPQDEQQHSSQHGGVPLQNNTQRLTQQQRQQQQQQQHEDVTPQPSSQTTARRCSLASLQGIGMDPLVPGLAYLGNTRNNSSSSSSSSNNATSNSNASGSPSITAAMSYALNCSDDEDEENNVTAKLGLGKDVVIALVEEVDDAKLDIKGGVQCSSNGFPSADFCPLEEPRNQAILEMKCCSACQWQLRHGSDSGKSSSRPSSVDIEAATCTPSRECSMEHIFLECPCSRGIYSQRELDEHAFQQLTSFQGCPELLRGTPLRAVMQHQGAIFKTNIGTRDTYQLSKVTEGPLSGFISHNWSVAWRRKFLCLALHYNFLIAAIAGYGALMLVGFLTYQGIMPSVDMDPRPPRCYIGRLVVMPFFFLVALLARDLIPACLLPKQQVFLDKTCIHQLDKSLQSRGILKIGAFLHHSEEMLVCYTDVYLTKLWTIFELGCFLCVNKHQRLTVIPTAVPSMLFVGLITAYMTEIALLLTKYIFVWVEFVGWIGCLYSMGRCFCDMEKEKVAMRKTLSTFTIRESLCSIEADRPLVYHCIGALLRGTHRVPENATEDMVLDAFDRMIQSELPGKFSECLKILGTKSRHIAIGCSFATLPRSMDDLVLVHLGMPFSFWLEKIFCLKVAQTLISFPLALLILRATASLVIDAKPVKKHVFLLFASACSSVVGKTSNVALRFLSTLPLDPWIGRLIYYPTISVLILVIWSIIHLNGLPVFLSRLTAASTRWRGSCGRRA